MEELKACLEKLKHDTKQPKNISNFYKKFGDCKLNNKSDENHFVEVLMPKICKLIENGIVQKDILYLTSLASGNDDLLQKCIKCCTQILNLNTDEPGTLFNYCAYTKQHWFIEVLNNCNNQLPGVFDESLCNKIRTIKCISITNSQQLDIDELKSLLPQINIEQLRAFWQGYIKEMAQIITWHDFCTKYNNSLDSTNLFLFACENGLLRTLSQFLQLNELNWTETSRLIADSTEQCETHAFTVFHILSTLVTLIIPDEKSVLDLGKNLNSILDNIKEQILNIDFKLQIELLENVFNLIFLREKHLRNSATDMDRYLCNEREVRLVLYLLKSILDDVKLKSMYNTAEYNRFVNLGKYVADASWRLELIMHVKANQCENNLLNYMLAPPHSLIYMCLKREDINRAYQVIRIFNMEEHPIAFEIKFFERFQFMREDLRKLYKMKSIQRESPNLTLNADVSVQGIVSNFLEQHSFYLNTEYETTIARLKKVHHFLNHLEFANESFMNIMDLCITQATLAPDDCRILLNFASEKSAMDVNVFSPYSTFCNKLFALFSQPEYKENSIPTLLANSSVNLDLIQQRRSDEFYENLSLLCDDFDEKYNHVEGGTLNANHLTHKVFMRINNLCNEYADKHLRTNENIKYLLKLFNYLKAFTKILYIEENSSDLISKGSNVSYFHLLHVNRSELTGKLLFERNLDPTEFEKYFGKLKLDYLYHVIGNCFPTINLHSQEIIAKDELYPENILHIPSKNIITYIQRRNWLLAYILNEMHHVEGLKIDISELRVQAFTNYMKLEKIAHLKVIYEHNLIITALQNDISAQKVANYIHKHISKCETNSLCLSLGSDHSNESLETAEEVAESACTSVNWKCFYDIIESVPENQVKKSTDFMQLRDMVLMNLIQDGFEPDCYKYAQRISNVDERVNVILKNFHKWPGSFTISLLRSEISRFDLSTLSKVTELEGWLKIVQFSEMNRSMLEAENWAECYAICKDSPEEVISKLLSHDKLDALLNYIELFRPDDEFLQTVHEIHISRAFTDNCDIPTMKSLLNILPYTQTVNICYNLIKLLKSVDHLQFIVDYLIDKVNDPSLLNMKLSLQMFRAFTPNEYESMLCLIRDPLSIIEILIMNTKLEKLGAVLTILNTELTHAKYVEVPIKLSKIDDMLRTYAGKSLDFRVITQPIPRLLRTPECKLMQSLDSLNICVENKTFVMPDEVPTKDEWVQNNEVLECMCCQQITFSMFNRRHHCRRCGRVICYNCSIKRMFVSMYGDILVRVCIDCFQQTFGSESDLAETMSSKSLVYDYWILTEDTDHNEIVRDEFSYEHAPSVSLCLSIMKFHSKTVDYPKFLLEQCDEMLKLLQPNQEPIQEIDYSLVIKMLKTLAMAAKMSSVECNLHIGNSLAERILSQADLLGLLAERGCLNLLPVSNNTQGPYIDSSVLRILRNKLLEREQWNLALEVSTKAGLDNTSVFAAWGKSCLKAGSLPQAREKFQRCLDKSGHYESSVSEQTSFQEFLDDDGSRSRCISRTSNVSSVSDTKPAKNPVLLNEIIQILELKTNTINRKMLEELNTQKLIISTSISVNQSFALPAQSDTAVSILNKLRNLKHIVNGNYNQDKEKVKRKSYAYKPTIDSIFYDECVYYLSKYGTHLSLLEFYIKHGEIEKTLRYITENQLNTDVFIDIYMRCLKDGIVNVFQEGMSKMDSSLDMWKNYLRQICRHLEKQNMLHSLYQLQLFLGDYIRAAMTCIRFYQENVKNFSDLLSRVNYLHAAEKHLKQVLEQDQWVEVASVGESSLNSQENFEEKCLTQSSLVMKLKSREIEKHISTIWNQIELLKFLAECEDNGINAIDIYANILPSKTDGKVKVPTLFDSTTEILYLAVLVIICGPNVQEGFPVALKIITEFKLKPVKVYCEVGKQLAKDERYDAIAQIIPDTSLCVGTFQVGSKSRVTSTLKLG